MPTTTTTTPATPLADALAALHAVEVDDAPAVAAAWAAYEASPEAAADNGPLQAAYDAAHAAEVRRRERAEADIIAKIEDADEPRTWQIWEDGNHYTDFSGTRAEAMAKAVAGVDPDVYRAGGDEDEDDEPGTYYVDVVIRCALTGERDGQTVPVDPLEPECEDGHEHDWYCPVEVVGGCRENPGVFGHGGGVILKVVCGHCGRYRITDTWAQRRDTGEQGLTEVTYREPDEDSLAWVASRAGVRRR